MGFACSSQPGGEWVTMAALNLHQSSPILCLWRDDMALCTLLVLLISYGPSLLMPSCCSEFSLCSSLPFVPLTFLQSLFVYVWLFRPHFFQWFLFLAMWMSLSIWLLGVLWLFSSHVTLDRQPVLFSGAGWVLWMCIQLNKDHQLSLPWQLGGRSQEQDVYQDGSLM